MLLVGRWRGLDVAVKRLLLQHMAGPEGDSIRRTAVQEAALNMTLDHPNIVSGGRCSYALGLPGCLQPNTKHP